MKIFTCASCKNVAFFENSQCVRCGHQLAYLADKGVLAALEPAPNAPDGAARFMALEPSANGVTYKLCRNYIDHAVCNWALPADDTHE
jgi:hypothetical protein